MGLAAVRKNFSFFRLGLAAEAVKKASTPSRKKSIVWRAEKPIESRFFRFLGVFEGVFVFFARKIRRLTVDAVLQGLARGYKGLSEEAERKN